MVRGLVARYLPLGLCPTAPLAGDGAVALQTADPSCRSGSRNIYVDCGNGTVTDNRTGLVWLKNASCLGGPVDWCLAMEFVAGLSDKPATSTAASHDCGLSDGSSPGEWRLPSVEEWEAMVADALGQEGDPDCTVSPPTITNDNGLGRWVNGISSFTGVLSDWYWSASTAVPINFSAPFVWVLNLADGEASGLAQKQFTFNVWPVRGGQ